jgi:hypothetical protein
MRNNTKPAPITANSVITGLLALPWGATLFGTATGHSTPHH